MSKASWVEFDKLFALALGALAVALVDLVAASIPHGLAASYLSLLLASSNS